MKTTTWTVAILAALLDSDLATAQGNPGWCGGGPCGVCIGQPPAPQKPPAQSEDTTTLLQRALAAEYFARDFYRAANARFEDRRFANLARAEQHHIDAMTAVVAAAGAVPATTAGREVKLPETLSATEEAAAALERTMIATYDTLLARVDDGPRPVLERIQRANRRHLGMTSRDAGQRGPGRGRGPKGPRGPQNNDRGPVGQDAVDFGARCAAGLGSCRR